MICDYLKLPFDRETRRGTCGFSATVYDSGWNHEKKGTVENTLRRKKIYVNGNPANHFANVSQGPIRI